MKAMAHPTRLYLVEELSRGERCVHELTELVGADMSTVSKHLALLKSVGIVQDERRGNAVYYSLRMRCVLSFFECIEEVLGQCPSPVCGRRTCER
jgi:DNA-binding transcriptional ArsR family regulator